MNNPLTTAVLFLVFNRLDTTKQVFNAIRQAKPPKLYIAADGARESREGESKKVQEVRNYLLNNIDWECDVQTLFRDENLGCKNAVSSAIDWFFSYEEMGIILEDDCLPSQSFFWFCENLLEKYANNNEIYSISGTGRATQFVEIKNDYAFIKYPEIWGWATWRRVWSQYDTNMSDWYEKKSTIIPTISTLKSCQRFWSKGFDEANKIDTWDTQFVYLMLKNQAKCIIPKLNLITNIGFREDATHTHNEDSKDANLERFEIKFPLTHPQNIAMNEKLNYIYDRYYYYLSPKFIKITKRIFKLFYKLKILKNSFPKPIR